VAEDVREGWVSRRRAEDVYRVVLTDDLRVDEAATRRLREG
jgi:N-methylhydantoinase B